MKILEGKSILLISPKTFGYELVIIDKLNELGATVVYFDDRPSTDIVSKIFIRIAPFLLKSKIDQYFIDIINKTNDLKFDYIFCIKQECFPKKLLQVLFDRHKYSKKIFYTWDSFENSSNALNNLSLFDQCFSFDHVDSMLFKLKHRPLFYFDNLSIPLNINIKYDLSFVGSIHIYRYRFLKKIKKSLEANNIIYFYQYVPSPLIYYIRKIFLFPYYGSSSISEFKFKTLSKDKLRDIFFSSKVIVDFAHHKQRGLTMRSIEALGARKKLITNNIHIKEYDFYNSKNILIIDDDKIDVPKSFIDQPYFDIDRNIYSRYSVEGWLRELLDI